MVGELRVRNVLVPIDGSEFALRSLPTARVLADRFGAMLHTVSVAEDDGEVDRLRRLGTAVLGVEAGDERAFVRRGGEPAEVIADRAGELSDCVLCLSTHGRGRLSGAFVGSVARSLVHRWSQPMVVLGPMADNPGWSPRPRSWPEPLSVPRIVACVDGSEASEQVLPVAAVWARSLAMGLTVVTVVEDLPDPIRPEMHRSPYGGGVDAHSYIEALVERLRGESVDVDVDGAVVRDPIDPAGGIRAHLADRPAGLVALTTHARSGTDRLRFGAQAAAIVHASTVPCLLAPVS